MIKKLLEKELHLHNLLNQKKPPEDINDQYQTLFKNPLYGALNKVLDIDMKVSAHDSIIVNFSENKILNHYQSSFNLDFMNFGNEKEILGYFKNSKFTFKSKESLRDISKALIMSLIIDSENKEVGLYFLKQNRQKIFTAQYEEFSFDLGEKLLTS